MYPTCRSSEVERTNENAELFPGIGFNIIPGKSILKHLVRQKIAWEVHIHKPPMQPFTYSKVGAFNRYFNSLLILIKYDPSSLIKTNIKWHLLCGLKSNIIEKGKIYSMFASEWGYSTVCSAGTCTPCSILFETYIQDISYLILHVHLTWKWIPLRPIMWIQHKFPKKSEKTKHGSMFFSFNQ